MRIDRRDFLASGAAQMLLAALLGSSSISLPRSAFGSNGNSIGRDLTAAGYPSEHVNGFINGEIGINNSVVQFQPSAIGDLNNHVFSGPRTLDFTEIGLIPYIIAFANEDFRAYSLIPVFPLRIFRHKSIFVRTDGEIDEPEDLRGKRIGAAGYSSTSLTAIRGLLLDEYGLRPEDMKWVISQKDSSAKDSGTASAQENVFPDGLDISTGPAGKDESDLLIDGDVDALFHAAEPRAYRERHPNIRRLFDDPRKVEQEYFKRTGIFPIMHAVAVRSDLIDHYPWFVSAVFNAYRKARDMAFKDLQLKWYLRTLPWLAQELEATQQLMGSNFYPYGVEPNRKALETMFRYAHEQGFAKKQLRIEEVFAPSTLNLIDG